MKDFQLRGLDYIHALMINVRFEPERVDGDLWRFIDTIEALIPCVKNMKELGDSHYEYFDLIVNQVNSEYPKLSGCSSVWKDVKIDGG